MHELVPKPTRFAVLLNPANVRYADATTKSLRNAAHVIGVEIAFFNASTPAEIDSAFTAIARERADALFIAAEAFFGSRRAQLATLTARDRIPASFSSCELVEALLMSYGTSLTDMARQVGVYTGGILKGARPADLPVQQPTKFELVINLKTAKALGLDVPPTLLAGADEVIE